MRCKYFVSQHTQYLICARAQHVHLLPLLLLVRLFKASKGPHASTSQTLTVEDCALWCCVL
jgi:hypothetical protein